MFPTCKKWKTFFALLGLLFSAIPNTKKCKNVPPNPPPQQKKKLTYNQQGSTLSTGCVNQGGEWREREGEVSTWNNEQENV